MAGFDDILGGLDPYAGQRLAAAMSATLGADPGRLAYSSGPVGQALGQISGGFERANAVQLANTLAGERTAALPDLASAYSSDDPFKWAASNPQASPLARAMIVGSSPLDVAKTKEAGIEAAKAALNLRGWQGAGEPPATATTPIGAPASRRGPVVQPAPLTNPGGGAVNPYYPGDGAGGGTAGGGTAGAGAGGGATDLNAMSPQQLQQYAKGPLTAAEKYQLARAYIRRQAAGRTAPGQTAGPAGGAGPSPAS